ncbi:MAG: hypothetical protein ABIE70_00645 [bacterium]
MKTRSALAILLVCLFSLPSCSKQDQSGNPTPPNAEQINDLFQLVIDFEPLQKHYHPEVAGRDTLCLVVATDSLQLELTEHGVPVRIMHGVDECYNSLIVRTFAYSADTATFILGYDLANVICKQVYQWTGDGWRLADSHMIER